MMTSYSSRPSLNRLFSYCLSVGTLATLSVLLGFAPSLSTRHSYNLDFSSQASAQDNQKKLRNYAMSVMAMEPGRQKAYEEIKKLVGTPPNLECSKPDSLNALPANVKAIAVNYCNQSRKIVETNGLTIETFNQITVDMQKDPALQAQIQKIMLDIQTKK